MRFVAIAAVAACVYAPALAGPVVPFVHIPGGSVGFGKTADGRTARLYTLTNKNGTVVRFTDYGGLITEIQTRDRVGKRANVVLGFKSAAEYQARNGLYGFGSPIGRYAGRIGNARFSLDGKAYSFTPNNGANLLHGGAPGYNTRYWSVSMRPLSINHGAVLTLVSPDGDQGFPGKLTIQMRYTLTEHDELRIDYRATTTRPTVLNLTNHSYFNLAGEGNGDVGGHLIQIRANSIAEPDANLLPTGRIVEVTGPYDLRGPHVMRDGIAALKTMGQTGYDTPYVLANAPRKTPVLAVRVTEPISGRMMEVYTTEPSVIFFTANHLQGIDKGPSGRPYIQHAGFALETQHLPDSPNHPEWPTTVLRPGQVFKSTTIYKFVTPVDRLHS
ncbi:MAG TPA: aldose epimerase family protein [Sphingomonas sp.]|uniref:aldose epimerase family protein n=1 Tax=Sphingomonas sp. TaxID=28214 RepID=UPI002C3526A7|nr:aldose epimerase family protein [Sphingomonas sp.]HMI20326.1 aldose epimerase family protein [Sphingomonas sp.]